MKAWTFLPLLLWVSAGAWAGEIKSNQIADFHYASCTAQTCVILQAPKAYVGLDLENFVTSGETLLQVTDTKGKIASAFEGRSASYNPKLQLIILDTSLDGFLIYSLKDGTLSDFREKKRDPK